MKERSYKIFNNITINSNSVLGSIKLLTLIILIFRVNTKYNSYLREKCKNIM